MRIKVKESALTVHARALGCKREYPLIGLCVGCPFERACTVPRAPLILWTARINLELGRAEPHFYLNSLTSADIGKNRRDLREAGTSSFRTTSIQIRSGDLLTSDSPREEDHTLRPTLNLFEHLAPGQFPEKPMIVVDANQIRYNQISNFGRKAILAVQVSSREQAVLLSNLINENWRLMTTLIRQVRPLKPLGTQTARFNPGTAQEPPCPPVSA